MEYNATPKVSGIKNMTIYDSQIIVGKIRTSKDVHIFIPTICYFTWKIGL